MRNDYLSHNSQRYFPRYITLKFVSALFDSIVLQKFQGYQDSISFLTSCQFFLGQPLATSHHFHHLFCEGGIFDYYCYIGSITIFTLIAIKIKIIIIHFSINIIIIIIIIIGPTKYLKCYGITYSICFVFCCTLVRSFHFLCYFLHFQK